MAKYTIAAGVVACVVLVAGVLAFSGRQPKAVLENTSPSELQPAIDMDVVESSAPAEPVEGGPAADPISFPALFQQQLVGRDFTVGRVLAENESYTRYYITYESGGLTISGIMNVPKGEGLFPVLILNHGHIDTSIYTNGRGLKREQDYLARRGYVVIHPDYRNHAESDDDPNTDVQFRLGYVEDVINAIYAVRAADLPYVDGEKIGMLGHSMGGGVTLGALITQPGLVDAAVLFAPVSADARDNYERWTQRRPETAEKVRQLYGSPEENPEFWDNVSVETFLGRITAPILLHHGTVDESVPIGWSEKLETGLLGASKKITYYEYPGEPHEFIDAWPLVMQRTADFFDTQLKTAVDN